MARLFWSPRLIDTKTARPTSGDSRKVLAAKKAARRHHGRARSQSSNRNRGPLELGRPLSEDEIAALLKQHGSPILVASRYRHENRTVNFGRQLIGPVVFPFYWIAIKVALVFVVVTGLIPIVLFDTHGPPLAGLGY